MSTPAGAEPLRRIPQDGHVAGVCAGLGRRLGIDPLALRIGVLALSITGVGIPLYLVAWVLMPAEEEVAAAAPPAARGRLRPAPGSLLIASGVACLALSALLTTRELGLWIGDVVVWPFVLAAAGAALVWRQTVGRPGSEPAEAARPRDEAAPDPVEAPSARERAAAVSRAGAGTALILSAGLLVLYFSGALEGARDALLNVIVVVAALALVAGPFAVRAMRTISGERAARIRSQERAEVAAHLHDSVLQTLALVQKQAGDPRAVAALARRQERELRSWLSGGPEARPDERLADAIRAAAAEVDETHGVAVEVVTVGDHDLDERHRALVAAAREAMVNAARHAGDAGPVQVFVEARDGRTEVFVVDRGPGFDPDAVPADRHGVRESILGRMARHGGRAAVHRREIGTEVELVLEDDPS